MTEQKPTMQDVASLMQERRRYEGWLAAIELRRDDTPEHVFERVQADYKARLDRVGERLAAHQGSLSDELAGLQSRLALLDAEEQLRRDERAEVDLRAHVGELGEADVLEALRSIDESLARLGTEKAELRADVDRVSDFFAAASSSRGQVRPGSARPTEPTEPAEPAQSEPKRSEALEPQGPEAKAAAFDEIGFLTSVIGEQTAAGPESPMPGETDSHMPRAEDSKRAEVSSAPLVQDRSNEASFASNVPANTPIKLRASGPVEQSKTLKCAECGAMNYPTEWYCERCGAELAAL